jgi:hypothetical protein
MVQVLSHLNRTEIPSNHIMVRWTKNACRVLPDHLRMYQRDSPALTSTSFRHTALYRTAVELVQLGDSNPESFEVAMNNMLDAMPKITEASKIRDGLGLEQRLHEAAQTSEHLAQMGQTDGSRRHVRLSPNMGAPLKRKDLGRPTSARVRPGYEVSKPSKTRTRFCSVCRSKGHNSGGCPSVENATKKPRREARCSNCGLLGHKKNACAGRPPTMMG